MAPNRFCCPSCGAGLKTAASPQPGARIKCPRCNVLFQPTSEAITSEQPPRPALGRSPREEEQEDRSRRHRNIKRETARRPLLGALLGGSALLAPLLIAVLLAVWALSRQPAVVVEKPEAPPFPVKGVAQKRKGPVPRVKIDQPIKV